RQSGSSGGVSVLANRLQPKWNGGGSSVASPHQTNPLSNKMAQLPSGCPFSRPRWQCCSFLRKLSFSFERDPIHKAWRGPSRASTQGSLIARMFSLAIL
ncbi:MAG: hypothetical protein ABIP71_09260, partial [Verrucomicrobiota bacterium]